MIINQEPKKYIGHLWHFYQPPWQSDYWIDRISDECFDWLSKWLSIQDPKRFKVNVNISASLTERLQKNGHGEVLENLALAVERGVVEFVDSAAYHAPLPCLPEKIRKEATLRQIEKNRKINSAFFGDLWHPKGFFPPEMMFSPELAQILKSEGYDWTITEDSVFEAGNNGAIPHNSIATVDGLKVFFRSGDWSNKFSMQYPNHAALAKENPSELIRRFTDDMSRGLSSWFNDSKEREGYAILAYDGETIGHHQKMYNKESMDQYVSQLSQHNILSNHITQLTDVFQRRFILEPSINNPLKGSWSTGPDEIRAGNYYPLWKNADNPIHKAYWELIEAAASRGLDDRLDKALNSCPLWWANPNDPKGQYRPELVRIGADELHRIAEEDTQQAYDKLMMLLQ
jgi:predicted glycosyl hydrolase (DUF1957 family)